VLVRAAQFDFLAGVFGGHLKDIGEVSDVLIRCAFHAVKEVVRKV
jgi:hypothetical protein